MARPTHPHGVTSASANGGERLCGVCRAELQPGVRCHAESYGYVVGREGRHFGYCWGGRFPTADEEHEWLTRHAHTDTPPPPREHLQLDFNL
jgi:hypothetical protein